MGNVFIPEKLSLKDSQVLNLTWLPETELKRVIKTPKLYVETYVKKSNYINLDDSNQYQFRNDYGVSDKPTILDVSQYCLPGPNNEVKMIMLKSAYRLDVDISNNHKKFLLEFGIRDSESNTDYKLLELNQEFNHDKLLLSRPILKLFDGLEKTELNSLEVTNTKFFIRVTNKLLIVYDSRMKQLYTFSFIPGNHLYFKITSDTHIQSDLILTRSPL